MKRNPLRVFAAASIVIAGTVLMICLVVFGLDNKTAATRDYLQYWSAEQLFVHGGNPYDAAELFKLQRSVGFDKPSALISLSPPVAFVFALPLGWMSARNGLALWILLQMACLLASIWLLWLRTGRPESRYHLMGLCFPPALWSLISGQLGIFFLLEIALFLYFEHRSMPFLAGASLAFCTLKPHLFVPFFLVLLLWTLHKRQWRALAGFAVALTIGCGLTLSLDRQIWTQYAQMMRGSGVTNLYIPTVSMTLRYGVNGHAAWIGYIAEACGCVWAAWYFWTRRGRWNWMDQGLLVLLVAVAATPYSWYTDQAVVFPAVLAGLLANEKRLIPMLLLALIAGAGLISIMADIPLTTGFYAWTAPAWLAWSLYSGRAGASGAGAASEAAPC